MKGLSLILLSALAAVALAGCGAPATNSTAANIRATNANATKQVEMPTVEGLKAIEAKAFEAYKNKDGKFFDGFLTDKFVASRTGQLVDKAATVTMIAEHKCDIKSFSFSDEKLTAVGTLTAILTMKVAVDGTCDGQKMPSPLISGTLYVRSGTEWKGAWHGEVPVVDPAAPPATAKRGSQKTPDLTPPPNRPMDAGTGMLAAIEKSVWEGWMNRDGKKLDELTARDLAFVNIFGDYFPNRASTLKNWSENPCEVKSVDVADASSVTITGDTSILFHKGTANGTCFGQKIGPIRGTSVYVKDGSDWKLAFTMNMPIS